DFYDNQIPKLALNNNNNIDLQNKVMISLRSIGHLKIMGTLNGNEIEKLSFHHQKYLDIFENELYPDVKSRPTSISLKDIDNLIQSYVELNKESWMKGVKDIEKILFQKSNYIHSLSFWRQDNDNKNQMLLDFTFFSTTTTCFMLRYLMTYRREDLNQIFKNCPIQIFCGKSYSSRMETISGWTSQKNQIIQNELKKWKVQIRLQQDKKNLALWYLNEEDVELFFEKVPPGEDCLKLQ
ncbi:hypothetical protein RFI_34525, partial [Reticulomyxa filosa]